MKLIPAASFALAITLALPASAHHSAAQFDFTKQTTLTGTVKEFDVLNPHTRAILEIPGKNGTKEVVFEGHSVSNFYRAGWRKGLVNAGDKVTIQFAPRRDGGDGGFIMQFMTASGKVVGFGNLSPSTGQAQ